MSLYLRQLMNLLLSRYHLSFFVIHLGYARNLYALTVGVLFQIISGFTGPSLPALCFSYNYVTNIECQKNFHSTFHYLVVVEERK